MPADNSNKKVRMTKRASGSKPDQLGQSGSKTSQNIAEAKKIAEDIKAKGKKK